MKWFRKKGKEDRSPNPLFVRLRTRIEQRLKQFAAYLQTKTSRYPAGKIKILLGCFCLVFVAASTWVIYAGFHNGSLSTLRVAPIRFIPLAANEKSSRLRPSEELVRVHRFKRYIDSLGSSDEGRRRRDSLLRGRPHLVDTLNFLENIYNNE